MSIALPAAAERRVRRLSVALVVVLLLGIGVALAFGIEAARGAADARAAQTNAEQAQQSEKTQRELAEQLKIQADMATERAEREHDRAERLVYARELALAQREWEANNAAAAWQYLEATHKDFRGWEYRYLVTLFNSNQRTLRGHTGYVSSVAFSPDGKRLASASGDDLHPNKPGEVKVWDVDKGQEVLTLKGHTGAVTSVGFSPDGKRLASTSRDQTVKVWDADKGQEKPGE